MKLTLKLYYSKNYCVIAVPNRTPTMTPKRLLPIFLVLFSLNSLAQNRTFAFSEIQSRNEKQEWGLSQRVGAQLARFTPTKIDVKADKDYHLNILKKTDLPNNGAIYLCKDEKANSVTIMLIDNVKMYIYSESKRFLINFDAFASHALMADTD